MEELIKIICIGNFTNDKGNHGRRYSHEQIRVLDWKDFKFLYESLQLN